MTEMRTIKFRAKPCYKCGKQSPWVYGTFQYIAQRRVKPGATDNGTFEPRNDKGCIVDLYGRKTEVLCDTIGQFTGMLDKNGKEIYEGDIVEVYDFTSVYASKYKGVVKMVHCSWVVEHVFYNSLSHPRLSFDDFAQQKTEIIGNIHDNPDLITIKIDTHKEDKE